MMNDIRGTSVMKLLFLLHSDGPLTYSQIVERTGMHISAVRTAMCHMRRTWGTDVFRIASWDKSTAPHMPRWTPGPGKDCPPPVTDPRPKYARYRARNLQRRRLLGRKAKTPIGMFEALMK